MRFPIEVISAGVAGVVLGALSVTPASAATGGVSCVAAVSTADTGPNGEGEVAFDIPSGVQVGDLLVLEASIDGTPTITSRDGFTKIGYSQAIGSGEKTYIFYKVLTPANIGPGGDVPFTYGSLFVDTPGLKAATTVLDIRGEDQVNPILSDVSKVTSASYADQAVTVGRIAGLVDGAMLVAGLGADEGSTLPSTIPDGFALAAASAQGQLSELTTQPVPTAPNLGISPAVTFAFAPGAAFGMAAFEFAVAPAP